MDKAYDAPQLGPLTIAAANGRTLALLEAALGRYDDQLEQQLRRPRARPEYTRVATVAGNVVGWLFLEHRRVAIGPATIEVGAIGAIAANAEAVWTKLIGDGLRVLGESGLPLAFVTGQVEQFGPVGFAPYQFSVQTIQQPNGERTPTLRRLGVSDLDDLHALFQATYAALPLSEVRALPDWRAILGESNVLGLDDSKGRLAAYALPVGQTIVEAAATDSGTARALLAALPQYQLALPFTHRVTQAALQRGGTTTIVRPSGDSALAGVVDLPMMLEQLVSAFEQRLIGSRYAGWSGNIRIEIETERVTLAFREGHAEVIDGSRPADLRLRRVGLPALAQICLGYRSISDLRATRDLECDDSALGLLEILFPTLSN